LATVRTKTHSFIITGKACSSVGQTLWKQWSLCSMAVNYPSLFPVIISL